MSPLSCAIVVLNWNGRDLLAKFLPSLVAHAGAAKIYLADNASTDDSVAFVEHNFPSVVIIRNADNFGYARGYNEALQHVEEEIYCLINSDVEVQSGWLEPVLTLFSDPSIAIAQPKILDFKKPGYFEYAGAAGGFIDKFGFPYCRGRIFNHLERDTAQFDDVTDIFWASGACFFIRKSTFWELKGFDVDFFAHQEEIDLCWRAFNRGLRAVFCPASVVLHVGAATLQAGSPHKTFLNFRNSLWMLVKNLPARSLFFILFFRLSQDGIAGIHFLMNGKPRHLWAVLKSHFYFYLYFFKFFAKREKFQRSDYYHRSSIVWDYYVRKRRIFRDLI